MRNASARFSKDPGSAKLFLVKGEPLGEGATFCNADLADMLQTLAERGRVDTFYKGDIADKIAAAFRKNGGLVTADDLAAYQPVGIAPLTLDWRGHTIHTPPPTARGLTVPPALATLNAIRSADADMTTPAALPTRA